MKSSHLRKALELEQAIFLDRDGTINLDKGYVHTFEDWEWLPGAVEGLGKFISNAWLVFVVSNQSGIGRGYFSSDDLKTLEANIVDYLGRQGLKISGWYYCPHRPEDFCECRKPKPGLLLQAAREWNVDLEKSWMIGDRLRDVEAGIRAGCLAGLLRNAAYPQDENLARQKFPQIKVWNTLLEAADSICRHK